MDEKYIVDRVEGNNAVIEKENGDMYKISIENIKGDFNEGDILINKGEYFEIDKKFTLKRKNEINDSIKNMLEEWSNKCIWLKIKITNNVNGRWLDAE